MSSSAGNCVEHKECTQKQGYTCKLDGNFYTTGEYSKIVKEYDISGVTFDQRIESVMKKLDEDTIKILKVLLQDDDSYFSFDLRTNLEIIAKLEYIKNIKKFSIKNFE